MTFAAKDVFDVLLKSHASFYNVFLQEWVWISSQASICRFPQGLRLRSERSTLKKMLLEKIKVLYWPNCTEISLYYILFMNTWVFRETQSKVILWKIEWNSDVSPEPSFAGARCVTLENLIHLFGIGFSHLWNEELAIIYIGVPSMRSHSKISLNTKGMFSHYHQSNQYEDF